MGDLHQPLRVGFTDDRGGIATKVWFDGKEQPLRDLWDIGLLETEKGSAKAIAARLGQHYSADERKAWEAGTPKEWADQTLALTIQYVYPLPPSHEISADCAKRAMPVINKRLAPAGVRLAWLLNEVLK